MTLSGGVRRIASTLKLISAYVMNGGRVRCAFPQLRWERGFFAETDRDSSITIGKRCHFRRDLQLRARYGGRLSIGEDSFASSNVSITALEDIVIGRRAKIGNNVVIVDHDHDYRNGNVGYKTSPVVVGEGVWIGANAVILKGSRIGDGAVIAAGAVVRGDIPAGAVAAGVPASVISRGGQ